MKITGHKNHTNDELLVDKYRNTGNISVLGVLYERYMPLVYGVCLKYLKNRDEAKDAVIEIFEKLVIELATKDIEKFRPWLYVVAKNHCLMKLRKMRNEHSMEKIYINDAIVFMESEEEMHPLDESGPDMNELLKECIEKLKDEQKNCIQLFYLEHKSYLTIAELLGLEVKKVKSFIQNGKRNLKNCIEEKK
ncbi:MAG: sigma-70 family RNA polymerase sigma factor [Chlorobi bacterium]|nr:sigma-70 family RNA polymerase sigma factor [Chlorobiota bacterium]